MASDYYFLIPISVAIIITIVSVIIRKRTLASSKAAGGERTPPGPWKLPIIGNLHQLAIGSSLPHRRLAELAQQYGPLMQLQLGEIPTVIVSSAEWAKEFMQAHDLNFASRPFIPAANIIFYGGRDIGFSPHGPYWTKMRKIVAMELLGARRTKLLRPIMEQEMAKLVGLINTKPTINLTEMMLSFGNSITCRAAFGKIQKQEEVFLPFIKQFMKMLGGFSLVDLFPSSNLLRLLVANAAERKLKKVHSAADAIMETIINDRLAKRSSTVAAGGNDDEDLLGVLLNLKDTDDLGFTEIKAVILVSHLDMFLAGSDTWTITVEWAMSELMKHPRVMEKAQREQLVLKETLRLHPPGPLAIPRESKETIVVNGYKIPAKTRVFVNLWAINRDPHHWAQPEVFEPERFLNSSVDFRGTDFHYLPFGAGRRMCPGMHYGLALAYLSLANLIYHFDWKLPHQMKPEDLDMRERFGIEVKRQNNLIRA
ncbi:unnamed protein product [Linum tenue]|uniref:Cytochrome P450 n=1 Tax=Linum tenue TaxID=586396 RepID=A0AAV0NA02_9ROSI|nr:unnamed protein product [Linum tenue]CAI0456040.1 unnamed protein product [Linum tenue]